MQRVNDAMRCRMSCMVCRRLKLLYTERVLHNAQGPRSKRRWCVSKDRHRDPGRTGPRRSLARQSGLSVVCPWEPSLSWVRRKETRRSRQVSAPGPAIEKKCGVSSSHACSNFLLRCRQAMLLVSVSGFAGRGPWAGCVPRTETAEVAALRAPDRTAGDHHETLSMYGAALQPRSRPQRRRVANRDHHRTWAWSRVSVSLRSLSVRLEMPRQMIHSTGRSGTDGEHSARAGLNLRMPSIADSVTRAREIEVDRS